VTVLAAVDLAAVRAILRRYGLELVIVPPDEPIIGSYWGESEAGLVANRVYARLDTPLHSLLHEASHSIVMGEARRAALDRDAGGDHAEENSVCYLQILLADEVPAYGRVEMWRDMDAWGYTFRLGSARAWFENEADDAREALLALGIATIVGGTVRLDGGAVRS
jgi:hypothetical protein